MRGNRAVQGLPAPRKGLACGAKPRSSEKGQGGRRPGRVGAAGQGKPLKGANLTGGTGRFTRVMCQQTRHTGNNREGIAVKPPCAGEQSPKEAENLMRVTGPAAYQR
jgi:hypothetical protein